MKRCRVQVRPSLLWDLGLAAASLSFSFFCEMGMPVPALSPGVGQGVAPGWEEWRQGVWVCVCGVQWGTVFIWILALACHCPEPSSPAVQPQARPFPLGSEAAAAGLCAGQCILKVNGNNVMNDGAPEVLEHFQAFRSRREEALVSPSAAKGIGEALPSGVRAKVFFLPLWENLKVAP